MRILIVRHGEPDYENDSLTRRGRVEADLLVPRMVKEKEALTQIYVSPLGRAQETAAPTLKALGRTAITLEWLQEFPAKLDINGDRFLTDAYPDTRIREDGTYADRIVWDMLPGAMHSVPEYFDSKMWRNTPTAQHSDMGKVYDHICSEFDKLMEEYGYVREGTLYHAVRPNHDTIVFFCHFGLTCVLLAHLWDVSPMILMQSLCTAPTAVTELYTEEREEGIAIFRADKIGDVSHLYAAGQEPSPHARFCETFSDGTRH